MPEEAPRAAVYHIELEQPLGDVPGDETDVSLRAHFLRMSNDRLRSYVATWSDEQVMAWDGNFRSDGTLMLVCCERDVGIGEYRQVLHEHIRRRGLSISP